MPELPPLIQQHTLASGSRSSHIHRAAVAELLNTRSKPRMWVGCLNISRRRSTTHRRRIDLRTRTLRIEPLVTIVGLDA